ncbi:hypothetical protein HRbin07_00690 [bacterium HR07]|nr:hypothetical protein HRbin07_00690 [bacterium HR07]
MIPTSKISAGRSVTGMPVKGSLTTLAELYFRVSVPSIERTGMNGTPIAAALKRQAIAALLHSTSLILPPSAARRKILDSPSTSYPTYVMSIASTKPAATRKSISSSPCPASLSLFLPWRTISRMIDMGQRTVP